MAKVKGNRRNDEIEASEVRVIDAEGNQVGVRKLNEALELASAAGMDLVEIAPNSEPPVCRIMDYGKYRFQQAKKHQAARKKQKQVQIKEVKFRPATDDADYRIKMRNLFRFLEDGNKVKVTIRFRGREMAHKELGAEVLDRVENDAAEYATVEQRPQMEGRQMVMVLTPRK